MLLLPKITYTISLVMHNFSIQISIMTIIKLDKIAHCQNSFACQPPAKLLNGITARRKSPTASHLPVIKQIIKAMAILINFSKNSVYPYRYTLPSSSLIFRKRFGNPQYDWLTFQSYYFTFLNLLACSGNSGWWTIHAQAVLALWITNIKAIQFAKTPNLEINFFIIFVPPSYLFTTPYL